MSLKIFVPWFVVIKLSTNLVVHIARGEVLHLREESLHVGSRQIHLQPEEHGARSRGGHVINIQHVVVT